MSVFTVAIFLLALLLHSLVKAASTDVVLENVALGKPCNMSSCYDDEEFCNTCNTANNGNKRPVFANNTCIHTAPRNVDNNPPWTVDCGKDYLIVNITVVVRNFAVDTRSAGMSVSIDGREVYRFQPPYSVTTLISLSPPVLGRYVTVSKDREILQLCEVEVYAVSGYRNLAQGKLCSMSKIYYWDRDNNGNDTANNTCNAAINGNISTVHRKGNCVWTHWEDRNPHWTVILGNGNFVLYNIVIYAAGDLKDKALVHMENLKVWLDGSLIYTFSSQKANITVKTVIPLSVPQAANNVTLSRDDRLPGNKTVYTYIRFCEIQVWGTCKRGYYGINCDQPCGAVTGPRCVRDVCDPDNGSCVCNNGLSNPPDCLGCPVGRYGTDCKPCGQCKGGPTACNISTGHCNGGCLPGWKPPLCQEACSQGSFDTNCSKACGRGCSSICTDSRQPNCRFCNHVNGACECRANWTNGLFRPCAVCAPGRYNRSSDCTMRCGKCGHGETCNSSTGHCSSCQGRFVMPLCQHECLIGQYGDNCSKLCSWGCKETCPSPSSADCRVCDHVTGACPCKTGWTNSSSGYCTGCGPGYYNMSSDCSLRCGQCAGQYCDVITGQCASQPCDVITGRCKSCQPGFLPPLCQQACSDGYYGQDCSEKCGHCFDDQPCNKSTGHCPLCATGYKQDMLCKTDCPDGYYGQNCSEKCGHCLDDQPCNKSTGYCPLCATGYKQDMLCKTECEDYSFGENCSQTCGHCDKKVPCHKANGTCPVHEYKSTVCEGPYQPPFCHETCHDGNYGQDCKEECGHCLDDQDCNKSTGYCPLCATGYKPDMLCKTVCEDWTYGQNCSATCGRCWAGAPCDKVTGTCPMSADKGQWCEDGYKGETCHVLIEESSSLVGVIVGCIIVVLLVAGVAVAVVLFLRRRRSKQKSPAQDHLTGPRAHHDQFLLARPGRSCGTENPAFGVRPTDQGRGSNTNKENVYLNVSQRMTNDGDQSSASHIYVNVVPKCQAGSKGQDAPALPAKKTEVVVCKMSKKSKDDEPVEEDVYEHAYRYASYSSKADSVLDPFQRQLLACLADPQALENDFKEFPRGMPHPHNTGMDPLNVGKNRFQKLCAYDKNRVVLTRPEGDLDTDYVNASWIRGIDNDRAYIATQGPRHNTVSDLWWMVWQENVTQIVMLTNLKEDGKDKCEQYWPAQGQTKSYGHVTVTSTEEDARADFVVRSFLIRVKKGGVSKQREVHQYHYKSWPDHAVPTASSLVGFWHYVTMHQHSASPPVIHCSAGVGRTGTYIALDIAINQKARGHDVIMYDIVMELREQRSIMVQTAVQYKFLHEVVLEAYSARHSWINVEEMDVRFPTTIDLHKPNSILDKEFKLLKEMRAWAKPNTTVGSLEENRHKNRDPDILPDDNIMAFLSVNVKGRNNYINAVFMSSFRLRRGLLLTQLPLPDTVVDLWRLVEGSGVTTIISLGSHIEEAGQDFCQYWPQHLKDPLKVGPYKVTLTRAVIVSDHVKSYHMDMLRKDKENQEVRVLHYTDWSGDLPGTISDVIQLVDMVKVAQEKDSTPIIIQCLDGATKSGLFCVLYDVIMRVINDDEVSVFTAVHHIHSIRPQAVTTEVQYRYCYKVVQEVKRNRNVYANMMAD